MVEAVLFDLFETLITESETRPPGASSLGPRLGFEAVQFRNQWKLRRAAITLGQLSFVDALCGIGVALGSAPDASLLEELRQERVRVKAVPLERIEPSVVRMVDELLRRGKRIGVVSNCFAEDVATWSESLLAGRVHSAVFSYQVGLAKPAPEIYFEAIRRLGATRARTVFIGDGADDELSGAMEAGLRAYRATWFNSRRDKSQGEDGTTPTEWALQTPDDVACVAG